MSQPPCSLYVVSDAHFGIRVCCRGCDQKQDTGAYNPSLGFLKAAGDEMIFKCEQRAQENEQA